MTATPPTAGRGDTDSGGEDRWAGTPWVEAANLAREVLLAEPASWVVYRIGAALAARPAGDRAQPTQEQREAIGRTLATADGVLWNSLSEKIGTCDHYRQRADALLAGPLAALLDAQAAVSRVEALATAMAATNAPAPVVRALRRALGGTT